MNMSVNETNVDFGFLHRLSFDLLEVFTFDFSGVNVSRVTHGDTTLGIQLDGEGVFLTSFVRSPQVHHDHQQTEEDAVGTEVGEEPSVLPVVGQVGSSDDDSFVTNQQQDASDDDTESESEALVHFGLDGLGGVSQFLDGVVQSLEDPHVDQRDEEGTRGDDGDDPPSRLFSLGSVLAVDVVLSEGVGGDEREHDQDDLDQALSVQRWLGDSPSEASSQQKHVRHTLLDSRTSNGQSDHRVPSVSNEVPVVQGNIPAQSFGQTDEDGDAHEVVDGEQDVLPLAAHDDPQESESDVSNTQPSVESELVVFFTWQVTVSGLGFEFTRQHLGETLVLGVTVGQSDEVQTTLLDLSWLTFNLSGQGGVSRGHLPGERVDVDLLVTVGSRVGQDQGVQVGALLGIDVFLGTTEVGAVDLFEVGGVDNTQLDTGGLDLTIGGDWSSERNAWGLVCVESEEVHDFQSLWAWKLSLVQPPLFGIHGAGKTQEGQTGLHYAHL